MSSGVLCGVSRSQPIKSAAHCRDMDALRNTLSLQSIKTRQIVYQDPSGSFPTVGAVLNVIDRQGHTDWTRDLSVNSVTLMNTLSGPGRLTYSNTGALMLNGVPVGGGGSSVVGGTNISVAGSTVNFDPTKGGGVNMLNSPLTHNTRIEFGGDVDITCNSLSTQKAFHTTNASLGPYNTKYYIGDYSGSGAGMEYNALTQILTVNNPAVFSPLLPGQGIVSVGGVQSIVGPATTELIGERVNFTYSGKDSSILFNTTTSANGSLTVTNTTGTPQFGTYTGVSGPSITMWSDSPSNLNNIAMVASNATTGTCSVTMKSTGGATNAAVSYTEGNKKLTVSCTENLAIAANNSGQAIEMGSALGYMLASTRDQPIVLMRKDASGMNIDSLLTIDLANTVKIGESTVVGDPILKLQSSTANAQLVLDSTDQLVITGSGGVATQIATPLNDVATGGPGMAGQVLTSQGTGLAPKWAYNTLPSYTIVGNTDISLNIPGASTLRIRVFTQASGGGGGGGSRGTLDYGGGGGGAGFTSEYIFNVPNGTLFTINNGAPGSGGILNYNGADALNSSFEATITGQTLRYETRGGKGGTAGDGGALTPGVGGAGDPAGDDGDGNIGGKGGGFYGGSSNNKNGGAGILPYGQYSGAGGGGGDGISPPGPLEVGGNGAPGFTRIEILDYF